MTAKQTSPKTAEQAPAKQGPAGFIDAALMERAIALRKEGRTMKQIGADLGVKATGYLAKKIKETYGADALAPAPKPAKVEPAPEQAKAKPARKPRARKATKPTTSTKEA
jgi:hypothetical protein